MQISSHHSDYNALMDAAQARALRLRREAIQAFWDDVGAAARRALRDLRRANAGRSHHYRVEA